MSVIIQKRTMGMQLFPETARNFFIDYLSAYLDFPHGRNQHQGDYFFVEGPSVGILRSAFLTLHLGWLHILEDCSLAL